MVRTVAIADVAQVNPPCPRSISSDTSRKVSFVPMAAVSADGYVAAEEERTVGQVSAGFTDFERGDVVVAKITPCVENGKAAHTTNLKHEIGFGTTEFHVLRPGPETHGRYLFYMIWNPHFRFLAARNMTGSAGQRRVPADFVRRFAIPLPPLSEQKRIAAILDQADAIRRKRRQAIQVVVALPTAILLDMFGDPERNPKGWPAVTMSKLFASPPNYGTMQQPSNHPSGWLDLRVANIQEGVLDLSDSKYVELERTMIPRHEVRDGDLLLAPAIGSKEHLGKCIIARPGAERWAFDSHLMRIRLDQTRATPEFVQAFLASPGGRHEFLKHTRRSAVQFNVNTKEMAKVEIPLPPIHRQRDFANRIAQVRQLEQRVHCARQEADAVFDSLVQRAFGGEL